jgi:catechol 2,3-dioxygenase-like lactoylglutathione lyase family enzyme
MSITKFKEVHPVLPARDIDKALRFYVERLGFRLAFRDLPGPDAKYVGLRRDGVELHLQWHEEADFKGVEAGTLMLRFLVDDPDALFGEYKDKGVFHERTHLADTPWGTREFAFFDLDGNGLTFYRNR